MQQLRGVLAIPPAVYREDLSVDHEGVSRTVDFCLRCGVHGILIPVYATEYFLLTTQERKAILETAIRTMPMDFDYLLQRLTELEHFSYVKEETADSRQLISRLHRYELEHPDGVLKGVMGGNGSRNLVEEYDRGICATMPSCQFSDLVAAVWNLMEAGNMEEKQIYTINQIKMRISPILKSKVTKSLMSPAFCLSDTEVSATHLKLAFSLLMGNFTPPRTFSLRTFAYTCPYTLETSLINSLMMVSGIIAPMSAVTVGPLSPPALVSTSAGIGVPPCCPGSSGRRSL